MEENRTVTVMQGDQEVSVYIKSPSLTDNEKAESLRVRRWNQAITDGAVLAEKLNDILIKQGIWSEEKEQKVAEIRLEIADILNTIDKGGIKLSEARNLALKVKELRNELNVVIFSRLKYVNETVEGQSNNAQFNYLVSQCAVYNDNREKKYFKNYEDYLNRAGDIDTYIITAKAGEILHGISQETWPENKFLKERGFVDDKLRFINKDGHLVDSEGRLVDEDGNYIKYGENGESIFVDLEGNPLTEAAIERKPFLDDEGNEIV